MPYFTSLLLCRCVFLKHIYDSWCVLAWINFSFCFCWVNESPTYVHWQILGACYRFRFLGSNMSVWESRLSLGPVFRNHHYSYWNKEIEISFRFFFLNQLVKSSITYLIFWEMNQIIIKALSNTDLKIDRYHIKLILFCMMVKLWSNSLYYSGNPDLVRDTHLWEIWNSKKIFCMSSGKGSFSTH